MDEDILKAILTFGFLAISYGLASSVIIAAAAPLLLAVGLSVIPLTFVNVAMLGAILLCLRFALN